MTETLQRIAQTDTPSGVEVPNNLTGLVIWAVGRFGIGIVGVALACYALQVVYNDQKAMMVEIIATDRQRAQNDALIADSLRRISMQLDTLDLKTSVIK